MARRCTRSGRERIASLRPPGKSRGIGEENRAEPLATFTPEGADKAVQPIDSEAVRYVLRVERE